jgi:hypothetical protein
LGDTGLPKMFNRFAQFFFYVDQLARLS